MKHSIAIALIGITTLTNNALSEMVTDDEKSKIIFDSSDYLTKDNPNSNHGTVVTGRDTERIFSIANFTGHGTVISGGDAEGECTIALHSGYGTILTGGHIKSTLTIINVGGHGTIIIGGDAEGTCTIAAPGSGNGSIVTDDDKSR